MVGGSEGETEVGVREKPDDRGRTTEDRKAGKLGCEEAGKQGA